MKFLFNRGKLYTFCSVLRLKYVPEEILKLGQPQKIACFWPAVANIAHARPGSKIYFLRNLDSFLRLGVSALFWEKQPLSGSPKIGALKIEATFLF